MKTLTLIIDEKIYESVKNFLSLFSPEKISISYNKAASESYIDEKYLSPNEVAKIKQFFIKNNLPVPQDLDNIPILYNESDLENDLNNLRKINLLK